MFNQPLNFSRNRAITSGMPCMSSTLDGWQVPLTLEKITQDVVDGDVVQSTEQVNFTGCFQPLRDDQLQFKPEGQRSWSWYWIHAKAGTLNLMTQDKIIFNGTRYKVMSVKDYSLNGFIEYQVILDYEDTE